MDHPYYTVTVANLNRGWSYTMTEGEEWDPADDVVLVSPLSYRWAFKDDVVPSHLEAVVGAVTLVARTASKVPDVQLGDLITIDVRIGTAGSRIIAPPPMRVTSAEVDLRTKGEYLATLSLGLTDLSIDWRSLQPGKVYQIASGAAAYGSARHHWRDRMAEISALIGYTIGCPTSWAGDEHPAVGNGNRGSTLYPILQVFEGSAEDNLLPLLNSHQPGGLTHSWATVYAPGLTHPTGYGSIAPSTWGPDSIGYENNAIPQPNSVVRVEAVPASRTMAVADLPLVFAWAEGRIELIPSTPPASPSVAQLALSSRWCSLPVKSRRSREGGLNWIRVLTKQYINNAGTLELNDGLTTVIDGTDVGQRGSVIREVQTHLLDATPGSGEVRPESGNVGAAFLNDSSALNSPWAYDSFTLYSSLIPAAQAAVVLPLLAPRIPGETDGDGRLVRHVTLYDLDPDIRYGAAPVYGFITGGQMTISGGDIVWDLSTTPGLPVRTGAAPTPVTIADVNAGSYSSHALADLDPLITIADLDYVDA